jgi:histidinol-phosphate aminotransferase
MTIRPRTEIEEIAPIAHGGHTAAHSPDALDFSSNVNPYGPSPRVQEGLSDISIGRHPDPRATPLRKFLAEVEKLDAEQLIVGNGSMDLIQHVAVAYIRSHDRVLIAGPTFNEYTRVAAMMGAEILRVDARAEDIFAPNRDAILRRAREVNPRVLFLCNPNNPTGGLLDLEAIEYLVRACPDTLFVLDEAFIRFVPDAASGRGMLRYPNVIVLRSLTKDYALTGLRVGYAMASTAIIASLETVQPPWSVNAFAQAATVTALRDENHLIQSLAELARAKDELVNQLEKMKITVLPSRVHYFLIRVGSAKIFTQQMREQNILVRDCTSFGLPEFVRIATQRPAENARLIQAIKELKCPLER